MRHLARRHSWIAGFLLILFLSVQLATAAYACTMGMNSMDEHLSMEATMSCADMAEQDAAQNDGQKALCMSHCQANAKHADHATPQIPAFIPFLVSIVVEPPVLDDASMLAERAQSQPRAPPPPHAILHCCFRT
ncbi:copper resistance protein [Cupriavidus metallidurans]|uniref:copper resistance protein n=1 Tax=Cupriavidus metallidurans TaxID=119219 RepID=UPI001CCB06B2|nr:copper resistance protein [Cupriavidus metallidurans]UBM08365.1 copper resistance protein [Cupriavidus metallidurans]